VTYEALKFIDGANFIVPKLEGLNVLVACQMSKLVSFDLVLSQFYLFHTKIRRVQKKDDLL